MRVLVTASAHFATAPDGSLWTPNASLSYRFWSRYLEVFDGVELLVRAAARPEPPSGWNQASGPGVSAVPVPDFLGPVQFLRCRGEVRRIAREAAAQAEAVQLRIPCVLGTEVRRALPKGRPYGVEVVGDPYDSFAPGSVRHPLRPLFRWWFSRQLRRECAEAAAAAYVTQEALQRRYPCPAGMVGFSDVELPDAALVPEPRPLTALPHPVVLITVATLAQLYKAPDVLIDATARCIKEGCDLKLVLVGDGRFRPELEARAAAHGVRDRICFRGQVPAGEAIRAELDRAHVFVLPSHQEGLPKAMVEAMARALPCIGSTVGGFPELVPIEDLVPPGNVEALANKLREITSDPERLARMSARNLARAQEYREDVLGERRRDFYRRVRDLTAGWLGRAGQDRLQGVACTR